MNNEVINNEKDDQFETCVEGHLALVKYELLGNTMILIHTEVPKELGGRGLGGEIVRFALDFAQSNGLGVIAKCPFARGYIDRHQEYARLVVE